MTLQVGTRTVFGSKSLERSYRRAVDFCRSVRQTGIISYPDGVVPIRSPLLRGQVEVRGLTGEDCEIESHSLPLPLLADTTKRFLSSRQIRLSVLGADSDDTLHSLIVYNFPRYPADLTVKRVNIQALSPTTKVWLRWVHQEDREYGVMIVFDNTLLHLANLGPGTNDFFNASIEGEEVLPEGPFKCKFRDVVGSENSQLILRHFLLPKDENGMIIELNSRVCASRLGNFAVML